MPDRFPLRFEIYIESRPAWVRLVGVCLVIAGSVWFTRTVVFAKAPIEFVSYSMLKGDYSPETSIARIKWDSHLTELRFAITSPTELDYSDLDITKEPDEWVYQSALDNRLNGCELIRVDGRQFISTATNRKSGDLAIKAAAVGRSFDPHASNNNSYSLLASHDGYRVRCAKLPGKFTLRIVFAAVTLRPALASQFSEPPAPGTSRFFAVEVAGANSDFDLFGQKANPQLVNLRGNYARRWKPFSISSQIKVSDGN